MKCFREILIFAAAGLVFGLAAIDSAEASKRRLSDGMGMSVGVKDPGPNRIVRDHRGEDRQRPAPRMTSGCSTHGYSRCTVRDHRQNKTFWTTGPSRRP